jgi:hypothetical protein
MENGESLGAATQVAGEIATRLEECNQDYAIGGAIALGYWAEPRGTLDVDLTLFLPAEKPATCLRLLQEIDCEFDAAESLELLQDHGFCRVQFQATRIDVFLPTTTFYEAAKQRRKRVLLGDQPIMIWDAETLCVFKLMFFRRKDIADLEQLIRVQGPVLDRQWIRDQTARMYGPRDARVQQWDELVAEFKD